MNRRVRCSAFWLELEPVEIDVPSDSDLCIQLISRKNVAKTWNPFEN